MFDKNNAEMDGLEQAIRELKKELLSGKIDPREGLPNDKVYGINSVIKGLYNFLGASLSTGKTAQAAVFSEVLTRLSFIIGAHAKDKGITVEEACAASKMPRFSIVSLFRCAIDSVGAKSKELGLTLETGSINAKETAGGLADIIIECIEEGMKEKDALEVMADVMRLKDVTGSKDGEKLHDATEGRDTSISRGCSCGCQDKKDIHEPSVPDFLAQLAKVKKLIDGLSPEEREQLGKTLLNKLLGK